MEIRDAVIVWFVFLLGQFLHLWLRSSYAVKNPSNWIQGLRDYLWANRRAIVARAFILNLFFLWWVGQPNLLTNIGQILADHMPAGWAPDAIRKIGMPLNPLTAGMLAFFSDVIFDKLTSKFGFLAEELPPLKPVDPLT